MLVTRFGKVALATGLLLLAPLALRACPGSGSATASATIAPPAGTAADVLRARVAALASDEMRGRGIGSPELDEARDLIRRWMEDAGLEAGLPGGWLQEFAGPQGEKLFNVVGKVQGAGEEYVVVGAHYDHLGVGPEGSPIAGQVFNGADDNASGVAALLEVASAVAGEPDLARTVYFVAFSAEEIGLVGSRHFVVHPPEPLEQAVAMINLDTVGRVVNDKLIIFGSATAEEFPEILKGVNFGFGFDLALRKAESEASDQKPFYEKGLPVLHVFSGAHGDYHRPSDDIEKLNFDALTRIAEFTSELVLYLAGDEVPLTFRPAGVEKMAQKAPQGPGQRRRVSVGTIPDFSREEGGILLSGVLPGSAAEEAGLQAGDLLVEMDGTAIDTINDYQAVLVAHQPGDRVSLKFVRDGEKREVFVTLRERSH